MQDCNLPPRGAVLGLACPAAGLVWFTIGSVLDLGKMCASLVKLECNVLHHGRVFSHLNPENLAFDPEQSEDQPSPTSRRRRWRARQQAILAARRSSDP